MARQRESMTTAEFSRAAGIPATVVTRLIREGKLRARKEGKSWKIPASQLDAGAVRELAGKGKKEKGRGPVRRTGGRTTAEAGTRSSPTAKAAAAPAEEAFSEVSAEGVPPQEASPAGEANYSVEEFAAMTYLTVRGVREWLRSGRLRGLCTPEGEWRVVASNLSVPEIRRLLRK